MYVHNIINMLVCIDMYMNTFMIILRSIQLSYLYLYSYLRESKTRTSPNKVIQSSLHKLPKALSRSLKISPFPQDTEMHSLANL